MTTLQDCRALDAKDELRSLRDLYVVPKDLVYLDGNSLGVMPKTVPDRVARGEQWRGENRLGMCHGVAAKEVRAKMKEGGYN